MKKAILWLLMAAMLLPLAVTPAQAAGLQTGWIRINYAGSTSTDTVLLDGRAVLAPLDWLEYYAADMNCQGNDVLRTYYTSAREQERDFAQRLFINTHDHSFWRGVFLDGGYWRLFGGTFSRWEEVRGQIWVPLEELLPLMEVTAQVKDGTLCMQPVLMTVFDALYRHGSALQLQRFDADKVVGNEAMTYSGYAISTLFDQRIDRLNVMSQDGRENDYRAIFTAYLKDNEVYLKTFDPEVSPLIAYCQKAKELDQNGKTVYTGYRVYSLVEFLETMDPAIYRRFSQAQSLDLPLDAADAAISVLEYTQAYLSQIQDHRKMLSAVYQYNSQHKGKPSYQAAQTVSDLYADDSARFMAIMVQGSQDLLYKIGQKAITDATSATLGPWFLAMDITKILCAEEYAYVASAGLMGMVDNTVEYAWQIYNKRLKSRDFTAEGLDGLRLSAMMTMVGTRYAYDAYWGKDSRQEDRKAVDALLSDLYLAGIYSEYCASDSYHTLHDQYSEALAGLERYTAEITVSAELCLLGGALEGGGYSRLKWGTLDTNDDAEPELVVEMAAIRDYLTWCGVLDLQAHSITHDDYNQEKTPYEFGALRLQRMYLTGDPSRMLNTLDAYMADRAGTVFSLQTDADGNGTLDRVYGVGDAMEAWLDVAADTPLLPDPEFSILTVLDLGTVLELKLNRSEELGQHYRRQRQNGLGMEARGEGGSLTVDHFAFRFVPQEGYVPAQSPAGHTLADLLGGMISKEEFLQNCEDGEFGFSGTAGGDSVWGMVDALGPQMVSVDRITGKLTLVGSVTTGMTYRQMKDAWPCTIALDNGFPNYEDGRIPAWNGPIPVPGEAELYEVNFYWMNTQSPAQEIWYVLLYFRGSGPDAQLLSAHFTREDAPTWELIEALLEQQ